MTDATALLAAIVAEPDNDVPVLALADFFGEHGAHELAVALRAAVVLRRNPTVYLVSTGSYSDYGVRGVFSSKENAEKYMAAHTDPAHAHRSDWNDVEEFRLNEGISLIDAGLFPFHVRMSAETGDHAQVTRAGYGTESATDPGRIFNGYPVVPGTRSFEVTVWARDETHAIKIANERRAMLLAQSPPPEVK